MPVNKEFQYDEVTANELVILFSGVIPSWASTPQGQRFVAAYRRLCEDRPRILPKNSNLTQNNVAREAGLHPTALKKNRYPELIELIKNYKMQAPPRRFSKGDKAKVNKVRIDKLANELEVVKQERDMAQSKVASLQIEILNLHERLNRMRGSDQGRKKRLSNNVLPIDPSQG